MYIIVIFYNKKQIYCSSHQWIFLLLNLHECSNITIQLYNNSILNKELDWLENFFAGFVVGMTSTFAGEKIRKVFCQEFLKQ